MNRIFRAAFAAGALSLTVIASASAVVPASPDTGFSGDGTLVLHSPPVGQAFSELKVLPNGRMVVVVLTSNEPAIQVYRLLRNGKPDPSFGGGDGTFAFGLAASYEHVRLAVDPSTGKIYVSTFVDSGSSPTTVWRLKPDGALDVAYGGSSTGHVTFNQRLVEDLTPAPGGKLVMVGADFAAHTATAWQLTDAGAPDPAFGSGGSTVLATGSDEVTSVVRQPTGRLAIAGDHYDPTASVLTAYRLTSSGHLDSSFSGDGKASINPSSTGVTTSTVWEPQVLVRPDGRTVYLAGLNQNAGGFRNAFVLGGLTARGTPDAVTGVHVLANIAAYDPRAVLQRDGKVVATGFVTPSGSNIGGVFRFTARGALDPTWSGDGILPFGGSDSAAGVGIDQWGGIRAGVTTGTSAPYDTTLLALKGTPTPTCNGVLATQFGSSGNDTITGTSGHDVLVGLGGKDTIRGLGGADLICGSGGNDSLYGGTGSDKILGGAGSDKIYGNAGADALFGNAGKDLLVGGPGADHLNGGPGRDTAH